MQKARVWWSLCLLLSIGVIAHAQNDCPTLVQQALTAVDTNCGDLSRNTACYGYNRVSASFTETVADDFFTAPSDLTGLDTLATIQTSPLDTALDQWGVAIMSVQANIPDSLPGQAVTFVLLGDAQLENAVNPQDAFVPADPIEVVTRVDANIRSGAGKNFNAYGAVLPNTTLPADGLSADGEWLRVVFEDKPAWVSRSVVKDDPALATLPVLDNTQNTPMQAFYLRTGIGEPTCAEAPRDTLMVQGPKNIKINLTVNGANIRLGSTVLFNTPSPDVMEITVLDGEADVIGGGENGDDLVIREGFRSQVCLSAPEDLGIDGESNDRTVACDFSKPEEVLQSDLGADWCFLQKVPSDLLHYAVDLRCPGHPETQNTNPTGNTGSGKCGDFAILSPTNGLVNFKSATYSWTAVKGAEQYALNFFNSQGAFMTGQFVDGSQTSVTLSNTDLADSFFSWQVHALKGGQIFCSTAPSATLQRDANPEAPPAQNGNTGVPTFSVYAACSGMNVTLNWQNLSLVGTSISFSGDYPGSSNANSGSIVTTISGISAENWVLGPSGVGGSLAPLTCP